MKQLALLRSLRERHGDVFALRLMEKRLLVAGHPDLAKQVFDAPSDVLCAGEANRKVLGPLLGDSSLILLDGRRHICHRRVLLPALQGARLASMADSIRAVAERHVDAWPLGEPIASLPLLRELSREVMIRTVFGDDDEAVDRLRPKVDAMQALSRAGRVNAAFRRAVADVEAEIARIVSERRRERDSATRADSLALLLQARSEEGVPFSDSEIHDEAATLIVAGTETTAASLAWALERLSRTPDALSQVAAEADAGGGPYTDAAIRETLRTRPPVRMVSRLARVPYRLGGRWIPEGELVAVSPLLIQHRPDVYSDPEQFRPERFLQRRPGAYAWIPFGGGVRRCAGASLAIAEMRIVLSTVFSKTTLRTPDPQPEEALGRANTMVPALDGQVVLGRQPRAAARVPPAIGGEDFRRTLEDRGEPLCAEVLDGSQTMLIAFGGMAGMLQIPPFEFFSLTRGMDVSRLFVRDLHQAWYHRGVPGQGATIDEVAESLKRIVAERQVEHLVVTGASSGAYAALVFGRLLNAGRVLSFAPQSTIDLETLGEMDDHRWDARLGPLVAKDALDGAWTDLTCAPAAFQASTTSCDIFFDDAFGPDREHAERLAGLERMRLHPRSFRGDHLIARSMRETGELEQVLRKALGEG